MKKILPLILIATSCANTNQPITAYTQTKKSHNWTEARSGNPNVKITEENRIAFDLANNLLLNTTLPKLKEKYGFETFQLFCNYGQEIELMQITFNQPQRKELKEARELYIDICNTIVNDFDEFNKTTPLFNDNSPTFYNHQLQLTFKAKDGTQSCDICLVNSNPKTNTIQYYTHNHELKTTLLIHTENYEQAKIPTSKEYYSTGGTPLIPKQS